MFLIFFILFFLLLFCFHFVCASVFVAVTLILVFVVLMLIFVFVDFCGVFVLVVVFLCCYVVKLGIAKKTETKKKHPQKSGSTSGHFLQDKLWLHVPKLLLFFWLFSCFFACWSKTL